MDRDDDDPAAYLGEIGCPEDGGRGAGHLENHVCARPTRLFAHPRDLVDDGRVKNREAQVDDRLPASEIQLDHDNVAAEFASRLAISTPIGPPLITTAFSPGTRPERRTLCTDTATGSTRAS